MPSFRLDTPAFALLLALPLALPGVAEGAETRDADPRSLEALHRACIPIPPRSAKAEIAQVAKSCRAFLAIAAPGDSRRDAAALKAGEALRALGKTEAALGHFDDIANRAGAMASTGKAPPPRGTPSAEAIQGVLLSAKLRGLDIRASHEIPEDPPIRRLEGSDGEPPDDVLPWLGLIEWGLRETRDRPQLRAEFQSLSLRAALALYHLGFVRPAVARLRSVAVDAAPGETAAKAADTLLATLEASAAWKEGRETADALAAAPGWKGTPYEKRYLARAGDFFVRQNRALLKEARHREVLANDDAFTRRYASTEAASQWFAVVAEAALALKGAPEAVRHYTELLRRAPDARAAPLALLYRARANEALFDFGAASSDYRSYLKNGYNGDDSDSEYVEDIEERILRLSWLSDRAISLPSNLKDLAICPVRLQRTCDFYQALHLLDLGPGRLDRSKADSLRVNFAATVPEKTQAAWLVLAVENTPSLSSRQRSGYLERIAAGVSRMDPVEQAYFMKRVPDLVAATYRSIREDLRSRRKITVHNALSDVVEQRGAELAALEKSTEAVATLPWLRVREETYRELAGMYSDLSEEIRGFRFPDSYRQGQHAAFRERSEDTLELCASKEKELLERWHEVAARFAPDKGLRASASRAPASRADANILLARLFPESGWNAAGGPQGVRAGWQKDLETGAWHRIVHVLSESRKRGVLPEPEALAMEALTYARAGSQTESLWRLGELRSRLAPPQAKLVTSHMFNSYLSSLPEVQMRELLGNSKKQ